MQLLKKIKEKTIARCCQAGPVYATLLIPVSCARDFRISGKGHRANTG